MASDKPEPELMVREEEGVHVELTYDHLDVVACMNRVKSPKAGAVVMFAGNIDVSLSIFSRLFTIATFEGKVCPRRRKDFAAMTNASDKSIRGHTRDAISPAGTGKLWGGVE